MQREENSFIFLQVVHMLTEKVFDCTVLKTQVVAIDCGF